MYILIFMTEYTQMYMRVYIYIYIHIYMFTYIYIYIYVYLHVYRYICMYIHIDICTYISKFICILTHIYICACICLHIEIWKYRCEHVQNNQLIHKHTHPTFYQSRHWMIGQHVDIIYVRLYLCICIWIYVPTCRNKCNWYTLKHVVLARIKGLKKSPKIPGNTFSGALLKSRFQNFAADAAKKKPREAQFLLAGVTGWNDAHLQLIFARNAAWRHPSNALSPVGPNMYSKIFSNTTPAAIDIESPDCVKWRETLMMMIAFIITLGEIM